MTKPEDLKQPINPEQPIEDIPELQRHLYRATQVEMTTIPLYLYAAYSIQTAGDNQWEPGISAFRTIRSVVIEEMLHLCLARNLLLATGAKTTFYDQDFVPRYPSPMPHREPKLELHLEPCTVELMERVFMPFELPEKAAAPPQSGGYNTIGQFYAAITDGLERLSGPELWRDPRPDLQYAGAYWNNPDGGGKPLAVTDLPSALGAIETIVEQGEGTNADDPMVPLHPANPEHDQEELSHYAKFKRIAEGYDPIYERWPVPKDPSRERMEGPVRDLAELFDAAYCYVLCMIDALYETTSNTIVKEQPSPRYGLERTFIAAMGGLLFPLAALLVSQPTNPGSKEHAAPTFEFHPFDEKAPKKDQLISLCDALVPAFPSLGGDDGVRSLLGKLPSV
jgi:hypothetical protein